MPTRLCACACVEDGERERKRETALIPAYFFSSYLELILQYFLHFAQIHIK